MQTEKAREGALSAVGDFDKTKLKKSETDVKNPLPSSEAIAQELEHIKFKVKTRNIHATFLLSFRITDYVVIFFV